MTEQVGLLPWCFHDASMVTATIIMARYSRARFLLTCHPWLLLFLSLLISFNLTMRMLLCGSRRHDGNDQRLGVVLKNSRGLDRSFQSMGRIPRVMVLQDFLAAKLKELQRVSSVRERCAGEVCMSCVVRDHATHDQMIRAMHGRMMTDDHINRDWRLRVFFDPTEIWSMMYVSSP